MKKSKSALSLLTAIIMVFAIMPTVMADFTPSLSNANSDGRLITSDLAVSYGNGETMTNTKYITDGFYFSVGETRTYSQNLSTLSDSVALDVITAYDATATPKTTTTSATTGIIQLTETNNTIEFSWNEEKVVKRLDMWLWPVGAISNYEIQYYDEALATWVSHTTGTLDQTQSIPEIDATNYETISSTAYIITFKPVSAKKVRFIASSLRDGVEVAKIAEIVPRSNNNVNLLANDQMATANSKTSNKWLHAIGTTASNGPGGSGKNRYTSPYALNFAASLVYASGKKSYTESYRYNNGNTNNFWPVYADNMWTGINVCPTDNNDLWYAVRFPNSPQVIDKISLPVTSGTISEFEVWYNNTESLSLGSGNSKSLEQTQLGWKLATTVSCNVSAGSTINTFVPGSIAAEYWMIKVTKFDTENLTVFSLPGFYTLGEYTSLFGEASIGGTADVSILTDDWLFREKEANVIRGGGLNTTYSGLPVSQHLDKVVTFSDENSGIIYSWDSPVTVKRLDIWMLSELGGISSFDIESSEDGIAWSKVIENGNLDLWDGANATVSNGVQPKDQNKKSSYYPIIFDAPVTTKNLRFVVKSFADDNLPEAFIAEAKLRTTNEINLSETCLLYSSNAERGMSPYLRNYDSSTDSTAPKYSGAYNGVIWKYGSGSFNYNLTPSTNNSRLWHGTNFGGSKAVINKISIKVGNGVIKKFKVYMAPDNSVKRLGGTANPTLIPLEHNEGKSWIEIATISCNISKTSTLEERTFEIPQAILADGIFIEFEDFDKETGTVITAIDMYALADYELESVVAPTDEKIEGTVAAGEKLTFSVFSCNYDAPDAKVFFALYEDGALSGVTVAPCALSGVKTQKAEYTIPATATGTLKVVAYLWDGKTLEPLVDTPVTAESTPAEAPAE